MSRIYLLRGGAPDKFNYTGTGKYEIVKLDHTNLVDLSEKEIRTMLSYGYIVSGSEDDIRFSNIINSRKIILPNIREELIHKDSELYRDLINSKLRYWIYPDFRTYKISSDPNIKKEKVLKCTLGSGSREVVVVNSKLAKKLGKPFVDRITTTTIESMFDKTINTGARVMGQDLIKDLDSKTKATANLVFRFGKFLGYVFTIVPDGDHLTTNWDRGVHIVSDFTDDCMKVLAKFLLKYLSDGIVNIDFHIDFDPNYKNNKCWITEFNWRIGNNFFESMAAGICLFEQYIKGEKFSMPKGYHEFIRYWTAGYLENNKLYRDKK